MKVVQHWPAENVREPGIRVRKLILVSTPSIRSSCKARSDLRQDSVRSNPLAMHFTRSES